MRFEYVMSNSAWFGLKFIVCSQFSQKIEKCVLEKY